MNILEPTPGFGWRGMEYAGASERLASEMVLALALVHHMVFAGGQDFNRCIESLKDFQRKWLLIEYVDIADPMVRHLPLRPKVDYSWYNIENFTTALRAHYREVEVLAKLSDTRTLFLAS